jgi:hypothetical protein
MSTYEENVSQLEEIYLTLKEAPELYNFNAYVVDEAIAALAKASRQMTLFDVARAEDIRIGWLSSSSDKFLLSTLEVIHQKWFDADSVIYSASNLLLPPVEETTQNVYNHRVAKFLAKHGQPVSLSESTYGWEDYDLIYDKRENPAKYEIVAVTHYFHDSWSEFVDTFSDNDDKVGLTAEVIYKNGLNRRVRYDGELSFALRNM